MSQQRPQRFKGGRGSKKRQVTIYQVPKIIQGKKLLLYIEDDIWVPFCKSGLTFSKVARDRKKERKGLSFREAEMWDPWASSVLLVSKTAGDKKKANSQ